MTQVQLWSAFAERLTITFAFPIAVFVFPHAHEADRAVLAVELTVPDRDTRETITVRTRRPCAPWSTDDDALEMLLDLIDVALRHEVHEALRLDGVRVRDPHAPR